MYFKNKIIISVCIIFLAYVAIKVTVPVAQLASNKVIVNQMENTDASTLAVNAVGNGGWIPGTIISVLAMGAIAFVITRKTKDSV